MAAIIYALMRFAGQIAGSFLLIRVKRRHLFIVSALCVSIGEFLPSRPGLATGDHAPHFPFVSGFVLMGTSSYLISKAGQDEAMGVVGYFPLIAVSIIAVAYHIGIGPIPWSYSGTCPTYSW